MLRIDTHHHAIPSFYRDLLRNAGVDEAGGRAVPEWSPEASLTTMAELECRDRDSVRFHAGDHDADRPADAAALARDLNDYLADLVAATA